MYITYMDMYICAYMHTNKKQTTVKEKTTEIQSCAL